MIFAHLYANVTVLSTAMVDKAMMLGSLGTFNAFSTYDGFFGT